LDCENGKAPPRFWRIGVFPPIAEIHAPYALEIHTRPKALQQLHILYLAFASAPAGYNMGKKRKRQVNDDAGPQIRKKPHNGEAVPDGIFHYRRLDDVPWDTQK
jgi:hypothetical protein